jgi:hypothetical protein
MEKITLRQKKKTKTKTQKIIFFKAGCKFAELISPQSVID